MKKTTLITGAALAFCGVCLLLVHGKASALDSSNSFPLIAGTQTSLTNAQVDPAENNQVIRAFIPTGSKSQNCLATMNDTDNFAYGTVLYCGERQPASLGNTPGILVSIFFPTPVIADLTMTVTVFQQGAKFYGAPTLCTSADGC
jgi:hypothetical protein